MRPKYIVKMLSNSELEFLLTHWLRSCETFHDYKETQRDIKKKIEL